MHGLLSHRLADLVVDLRLLSYTGSLCNHTGVPRNEAIDHQAKLAARGKFSPPSALPSMLCKPLPRSVSVVKQHLLPVQTFRKDASIVRTSSPRVTGTKEVETSLRPKKYIPVRMFGSSMSTYRARRAPRARSPTSAPVVARTYERHLTQAERREQHIKARAAMAVHQDPTYNHLYESVHPVTHTLLCPLTDHIRQPTPT